jgi:thymidylate synthase (FAD)
MGSDLSVCDAARVSFNKKWINYSFEENKALINYLAKHNHWSPFSHNSIQLRVSAPIFVARQLAKHQVGLSWNEVSRRYVNFTPEVWIPDTLRKAAKNIKQGSSTSLVENHDEILNNMQQVMKASVSCYNQMIESGVCPEQARAVLPQSMYTEWIWTGSLYAFFRVYSLRSDPSSQKETQIIADEIKKICKSIFPWSWEALENSIERST